MNLTLRIRVADSSSPIADTLLFEKKDRAKDVLFALHIALPHYYSFATMPEQRLVVK